MVCIPISSEISLLEIRDTCPIYLGSGRKKTKKLLSWSKQLLDVRSNTPEVFLRKGVLKICCKFKGKQPCRSVISIKLLCNFMEITLRHGCSPVNLLRISRTSFRKNTSGGLLLGVIRKYHVINKKRNNLKKIMMELIYSKVTERKLLLE